KSIVTVSPGSIALLVGAQLSAINEEESETTNGVGATAQHARPMIPTESIRQPVRPTPLSLPHRHRSWTLCPAAAAGKFTSVVMNPLEAPLQACRPPSGFPKFVL